MPSKHSEPTKQKALSKFCQGATLGQVVAAVDVPRDTVKGWKRRWQREGVLPKGQPVGHISPEEYRLWVNDNLDDLAHLIRNLNGKIPGPRPARTPGDVLCPLTSINWNDRLPILEKQLRSYTGRNVIWTNISTCQRRVSNLRERLDKLFDIVKLKVETALEDIAISVNQSSHEDLRENFTSLLFYHSVAVVLGEKGFLDERLKWCERESVEGHVELSRGRGWGLPPVPRVAKKGVKDAFERLINEVSNLRLVKELRPSFALLREESRDIRRALDNLLVV